LYNIQLLPSPNTPSNSLQVGSGVAGIGAQQEVSGYSATQASGQSYVITLPMLYQNGVFQSLPIPASLGDSAQPTAISQNGLVAGNAWNSSTPFTQSPLLWKNGTASPLDLGGYAQGYASSINNLGQVGGYVAPSANPAATVAAWWDSSGALHELGAFGGDSATVRGINNSGQLLVESQSASSNQIILWTAGTTQAIPGATHGAVALNDSGHVVYTGVNSGLPTYSLWNGTNSTILPALSGDIAGLYFSINNNDQAVGTSTDFDESIHPSRAILWDDGTLYDLNSLLPANSSWILTRADAIAPDGSIIGEGYFQNEFGYFLATPVASSDFSVPEPHTLAFFIFATLPLLLIRRGRRSIKAITTSASF
jgi:hypothetical protein